MMRKLIIENKWEYEITKNEGIGLKGYGYHLEVFKNDVLVYKDGSFGGISMAQVNARDYYLFSEFGIERNED